MVTVVSAQLCLAVLLDIHADCAVRNDCQYCCLIDRLMTSRMNTVTPCRLRQSNDEWCVAAIYLDHVTTPTWSSSHTSDDVTPRLSYNLSAAVVSGDENVDASSTTKRKGRPPVSLRPDKQRQWRQREFKVGGTNRRMGWGVRGVPSHTLPPPVVRWEGSGEGAVPLPQKSFAL